MMKKRILLSSLLMLALSMAAHAQLGPFADVTLGIDTNLYSLKTNMVSYHGKNSLYFEYQTRYDNCEIRMYPKPDAAIESVSISPSGLYDIIDSLVWVDSCCYLGRIRFVDLMNNVQPSLLFKIVRTENETSRTTIREVPLFPYNQTWVKFFPPSDQLFVGEEKIFELETNNIDNIRITGQWQQSGGLDYRVALRDGRLVMHVVPKVLGQQTLNVELETLAPFLDEDKKLSRLIHLPSRKMIVKASRLVFLNVDVKEITFEESARYHGTSVVIDNNRRLQIGKTYRIENQEHSGGPLIGEITMIKGLANDKVMAHMWVFNLHRSSQGYLYIKDGSEPLFITNVDITPRMQINTVMTLLEGGTWQNSNRVKPGQLVDVSIEGVALHKGRFAWQDVQDLTVDTLVQTETRRNFRMRIPMNINKKKIELINNGQPTGTFLVVDEYQRPRAYDYMTLKYSDKKLKVSEVQNIIIAQNTLDKFALSFDRSNIDAANSMYGKQYLDIDIRLLGKRDELIEMKTVKKTLVCPDESSPRAAYYRDKQCLVEDLNINNLISNNTNALESFGRVQLDIRQSPDMYSDPVIDKRIDVIYQPHFVFDIDLSLPAGMMIQNLGESQSDREARERFDKEMEMYDKSFDIWNRAIESGILPSSRDSFPIPMPVRARKASFTDNLGGVSIALIAQVSFPDAYKAGKLKPYRVGAGFLFINVFNFSENAKRDLAAVVVGSIYPLGRRRIFNVPIHLGFGYKIQDRIPFLMISPGISVSF